MIEDTKKQLFWVSVFFGILLSAVVLFTCKLLLHLIFGSVSAEIMANAAANTLSAMLYIPGSAARKFFLFYNKKHQKG